MNYQYFNKHIDLDSESNGAYYLNEISKDGWRLKFIIYPTERKFTHPLCVFEKEILTQKEQKILEVIPKLRDN